MAEPDPNPKRKRVRAINGGPVGESGILTPPYSEEVERACISLCLRDVDFPARFLPLITPDCFFTSFTSVIHGAISALFDKASPINLVTVTEQLRSTGDFALPGRKVSGWDIDSFALSELITGSATYGEPEYLAGILLDYALRRRQIGVARELLGKAYDPLSEVGQVQDDTEAALVNAAASLRPKGLLSSASDHTEGVLHRLRQTADGHGPAISTGFAKLDSQLGGGWIGGRHYVFLAATGTGKTHLGLHFGRVASYAPEDGGQGLGVLYVSVEMDGPELTERCLIADSRVPVHSIQVGALIERDWQAMEWAQSRLNRSRLMFEDRPRLHLTDAETAVRRAVRYRGVRLIIVDYLQRMGFDGLENTYERGIARISGSMKSLAKELGVPVVSFSQIKGEAQEACAKGIRPSKGTARGSGDIDNDADFVGGLWRGDNHGIELDEKRQRYTGNWAELYGIKNRNGPIQADIIGWDPKCPGFYDGTPPMLGAAEQAELFPAQPGDAPF